MRTNYVLVDFENLQPADLTLLGEGPFKVQVFLGNTQTKVRTDIAIALQPMGSNATYIQVEGSGKNALDFHIAYQIGKIASSEPDSYFHIISNDAGFDPLIRYLTKNKLLVSRQTSIKGIPFIAAKAPATASFEDRLGSVLANLKAKKEAKPATLKTLTSTIQSIFSKSLSDEEVHRLIEAMKEKGWIVFSGTKVIYSLPS